MQDAAPIYEKTRAVLGFIDEKDAFAAPKSEAEVESVQGATGNEHRAITVLEPSKQRGRVM